MAKMQISSTRVEQFNKMVGMLRDIRRYDARKRVAELKSKGIAKEKALEVCINEIRGMATASRGISELKEVNHG